MKRRVLWIAVSAAMLLSLVSTPARADVARIPVRCGMVVMDDAYLYLEKDLYCAAPVAIQVGKDNGFETMYATIDLQGHTLRGTGSNIAVGLTLFDTTAIQPHITVINGRVENWADGVTSPELVRNVKFRNNGRAVRCRTCRIENSYFKYNVEGIQMIDEGGVRASVSRSTFADNTYGVAMTGTGFTTVSIDRSTFAGNTLGVYSWDSFFTALSITNSLFRRNQIALRLISLDSSCRRVQLIGDTFFENRYDIVGEVC